MIRTILRGVLLAAAASLAACGGGSDTCVPVTGGTVCDGTDTPVTQVVARLSLTLSATSINNTGGESITATVTAVNSANQTIADAPVLISVDSSAEIAVAGSVTNANGEISGTVRIGEDRSNRTITVTATAENGVRVAKSFLVVGAELAATAVPAVIEPSKPGQVKYRLVDANGNAMTSVPIVVTGVGGVETTATTGSNGDFDYNYTSPSTTGNLVLRASAGGATAETTVLVQAAGSGTIPPVDPAASPILSASVSANPSVIAINATGTSNQSQIRALFLTSGNAPVKNIRVRFDLAGDANNIGGSFTTLDNVVYSDANGVATSAYVSGTRGSPTDGVTVRACWDYVDFAAGACPRSVTTTLTVKDDPVSVSIGTNAAIGTGDSGLTYVKRFVVQVVDSSGLAKPGVQISPSIDLLKYKKGTWEIVGDFWVQFVQASCDNEDLNRNNVYEVYSDGWDEDVNRSFNLTPGRPALDPLKADIGISFEGAAVTDDKGQVVLRIEYPQDLGSWVQFNILVAASGVSGTEGRANYEGVLPVPANVVNNLNAEPPFRSSRYGVQGSALVSKTYNGRTSLLCTNPN